MQIYNDLLNIKNSSLALGYFDGLHLGHKVVLKNAIHIAKEYNTNSCVILFKNHPSLVISSNTVEQILTLNEKLEILNNIGIDNVVLLNFEDFASMSADSYLKDILIKYFSPVAITTGFNHTFGFNRKGTSQFLKDNQCAFGYKYYNVPPFVVKNNIVSCSVIRNLIHLGNFQDANELLGYKFFISGIVQHGDKIASKLGFPSANILYPEDKIKVPYGVYFVSVNIDGMNYNGILNHMRVPKLKTEVHIINFNKDIYGKNIKISFIAKIRNQIDFENSEKLKVQILRDIAFTEIYKHFVK